MCSAQPHISARGSYTTCAQPRGAHLAPNCSAGPVLASWLAIWRHSCVFEPSRGQRGMASLAAKGRRIVLLDLEEEGEGEDEDDCVDGEEGEADAEGGGGDEDEEEDVLMEEG